MIEQRLVATTGTRSRDDASESHAGAAETLDVALSQDALEERISRLTLHDPSPFPAPTHDRRQFTLQGHACTTTGAAGCATLSNGLMRRALVALSDCALAHKVQTAPGRHIPAIFLKSPSYHRLSDGLWQILPPSMPPPSTTELCSCTRSQVLCGASMHVLVSGFSMVDGEE